MALPKISVALLLFVVAFAAANEKSLVENKSDVPKVPVDETKLVKLINTNTTTPIPITSTTPNVTTSTIKPNTTTTTVPTPTPSPNSTTTTTTTTVSPSPTTHSPNITTVAPSTTVSPNVTTTAVPPTPTPAPAPAPGRRWDAPSFFGGMVLAFGIVAVGFVGYRFFYLGRGGAYHTL